MDNLVALATSSASLLGVAGGSGGGSIQDHLEQSIPGFGLLHNFFKTWLKVDITTLFVAVSLLGAASSGFASLREAASRLYWWIVRFLTASISISGSDRLNREVLNWLGSQVLASQGSRILTARSEAIQNDAWHYKRVQERNDYHHEKRVPVQYLPTFGLTWFLYERNLFVVRRILTPESHYNTALTPWMPDEYAGAPEGSEPLIIMCLGRSVEPIKRFLDTCRDFADKQRAAFITVRTHKSNRYDDSDSWNTTILRPMRPLETVHFDEKVKEELIADISNYLDPNTRQFYTARGIPYRRGYLLHGPPGTGKTSLSLALAGRFGLELYLLHIPSLREDSLLEMLFTALPPRCIVLLEDIDAVTLKRRSVSKSSDGSGDSQNHSSDDDEENSRDKYRGCRCTLSGLLNVLDGVASQEGRIVLMTSNHAERLDAALTRPGRIDRAIFLGFISKRSAELMFLRMYAPDSKMDIVPTSATKNVQLSREELEKLALGFSSHIREDAFTPAQLQGFLLNYREDPIQAATKVGEWASDELIRMEAAKVRAKKMAQARKKKRRQARFMALARLKPSDYPIDDPALSRGTVKIKSNGYVSVDESD